MTEKKIPDEIIEDAEDNLDDFVGLTSEAFDLEDLDDYEDLDATLTEMALSVIVEEEEEIADLEVEEAHFFDGSKYQRFKEWRPSSYGTKLTKKLDS